MRSSKDQLMRFFAASGGRAKKGLSQNFLVDGNILRKIISASGVERGDWVLEIGPGFGALTEALVRCGARVVAIEKDLTFEAPLRDLSICLEMGDACQFPLGDLERYGWQDKGRCIANLPYHITTPLLTKLFIEAPDRWESVTVMIQDEVARRITAGPGGKDYGSLTLFLQFFANIRYAFKVSPNCFYPKPRVHSAVVHMEVKDSFPLERERRVAFFTLTRAAFGQRRKFLANALRGIYSKELIFQVLLKMGLSERTRPETLTLQQYLELFHRLQN